MKLRTFTAATMKEAMARVRDEMGPDAIIVYAHERRRGGGVELRAAVENRTADIPRLQARPRDAEPNPQPLKQGRLAGAAGVASNARPATPRATPTPRANSAPAKTTTPAPKPTPNPAVKPALKPMAKPAPKPTGKPDPTPLTTTSTDNRTTLRRTTKKELAALSAAAKAGVSPLLPQHEATLKAVAATLQFHGLAPKTVEDLLKPVKPQDLTDPSTALAKALSQRLRFAPLTAKPKSGVMLVGGPGVGKTVTTAKLAAQALMAGYGIHVITTDTLRSGAIEQLQALISLMGGTVRSVDTPDELKRALTPRASDPTCLTLVDTPGINIFRPAERRDLVELMAAGNLEPVLVHAAGADPGEAAEMATLFAEIGARRLITTRLDAARRLGSLVSAASLGGLAIAEVSLSPYVSELLATLSASSLARILLAHASARQIDEQDLAGLAETNTRAARPRIATMETKAS